MSVFRDRFDAGQILGQKLSAMNLGKEVCVLALPRGGVPVAREVARQLDCPLDLLFVKKIGAPQHQEFAIGAVTESDVVWQQQSIDDLRISAGSLNTLAQSKQQELKVQLAKWRKGRPAAEVQGKTVIVVDDGIATGATFAAALRSLKRRRPKQIIAAAPVASEAAAAAISGLCDQAVILATPSPFFAVGQWYQDFSQVTDDEVQNLLGAVEGESVNVHGVRVPYGGPLSEGELVVPAKAKGLVIFAHGSGSTHKSPRNLRVSAALNKLGFATLLFDLLTPEEAQERSNVFNISLLVDRLRNATAWARDQEQVKGLPFGYFGASTGAAAALGAASGDDRILSVVCRGGRPDLAFEYLKEVSAKVLLIVGGEDHGVIELNERAKADLYNCEMVLVPGAGHLFEEGNTLDEVIEYAGNWFEQTLAPVKADVIAHPQKQIVEQIENSLQPLTEDGIAALAKSLADARVVMLGEATHGTEEFYKIRRLLSERLIEDHGFKFIAVEGDWPDCYRLNHYIQTGNGEMARLIMAQFNGGRLGCGQTSRPKG